MEKKDYIYSKLDEIRTVINRLEKMIPNDFVTLDLNAQKQLRQISDDHLPKPPKEISLTRFTQVGFTPGSPGWSPSSPTELTPSSPTYQNFFIIQIM